MFVRWKLAVSVVTRGQARGQDSLDSILNEAVAYVHIQECGFLVDH